MFQLAPETILVFWPSFLLGLLHSIFPCEDKAIFGFYAFGVSRDWRNALTLINFFGLGLMCGNLLMSLAFVFFLGEIILDYVPEIPLNFIAAFAMIIAGIIMSVLVYKHRIGPPEDREEGDSLAEFVSERKRGAFLLGIFSGIPPCFMELTILIQAALWSAQSGWYSGLLGVFFFGLGTWLGLFPLGLLGVVGSQAKKRRGINPHRVELVSAIMLVMLGFIYLILAIFNIQLFSR